MLSTDYYPSVAAASVLSSNSQFRHILFIGQDNDPTVMNALEKGYIYGTMWQNSYGQGVVAAQWLYKILANGCSINPKAPFTKFGKTAHFINSGYFFVGKDVAKTYAGGMESIPDTTTKVLGETDQILSWPIAGGRLGPLGFVFRNQTQRLRPYLADCADLDRLHHRRQRVSRQLQSLQCRPARCA